jgi:hypothetical protein
VPVGVTCDDAVVAVVELSARLWSDLEYLVKLRETDSLEDAESTFLWGPARVRLELLVLLDACNSRRWRSFLAPGKRRELRNFLIGVLDAIDVAPDGLTRQVIGEAQNRLLDEVLSQYEGLSKAGDPLRYRHNSLPDAQRPRGATAAGLRFRVPQN